MKKKMLFILFLALLLVVVGCSQQKNSVSKEYSIDNWDVVVVLTWDSSEVIGIVKPKYKGGKPLDYVVIEPKFWVEGWPDGYIPPNEGKYTWRAEIPEGAIPDIQDTSTRSNAELHNVPRVMTTKEGRTILERVRVNIEWKETNGETYTTRV